MCTGSSTGTGTTATNSLDWEVTISSTTATLAFDGAGAISWTAAEAIADIAANRIALGLYTWEPYMHNPKLTHRLHRISVPTLVIWGASDGLVKPDYGQAYAKLIKGAKFVAISEAGHSPHVEQPEAFLSQVLAFTD